MEEKKLNALVTDEVFEEVLEELEKKVREKNEEFEPQIAALITEAEAKLDAATDIVEANSLARSFKICYLRNGYESYGFKRSVMNEFRLLLEKKLGIEIEIDLVEQFEKKVRRGLWDFDIPANEYGSGWEHSAVC
jgi:hypothetical protein